MYTRFAIYQAKSVVVCSQKAYVKGQVDSGNIGNMGNTGNVGLPILPILPESISPILQNETGNIGNMGNMVKLTLPVLPILPVLSFSFLGIASILHTLRLNS